MTPPEGERRRDLAMFSAGLGLVTLTFAGWRRVFGRPTAAPPVPRPTLALGPGPSARTTIPERESEPAPESGAKVPEGDAVDDVTTELPALTPEVLAGLAGPWEDLFEPELFEAGPEPESEAEAESEEIEEPEPEPVPEVPQVSGPAPERRPPAERPEPDAPGTPWSARPAEIVLLGVVAVAVGAMFLGIPWLTAGIAAVILGAIGLWILAHHPIFVFVAMAFMLGAAPMIQTPVINISITFVLSAGIWVAVAFMPEAQHRVTWGVGLSGVLIGLSAFSFAGHPITSASIADFARWSITAAAVYPISVLPARHLALVGRCFVRGCTAAAVFGLLFVVLDRDGTRLHQLTIFGYGADTLNSRYVYTSAGAFSRLTGTYVDPNLGGYIMVFGLILGLVLLRGRQRFFSSVVLLLAIGLTLSRADQGAVAMAGVLLVLFSGLRGSIRRRLLALGTIGAGGMLAVPAVRVRLTNSFGSNDAGSSARLDSLKAFPHEMVGNWVFGRGFGAEEFINGQATALTNFVSNAPLLTVYRGGLVVGIAFTVLVLAGVRAGWRMLRQGDFEIAALGAGYLGLAIVEFQLDIPVVTLTPATLCFALLLAFVAQPDKVREVVQDTTARAELKRTTRDAVPAPEPVEEMSRG
ncbi:MAG: rane protein [Marmoricola sp.]|nr:rane protein [Marmoricola sp.]